MIMMLFVNTFLVINCSWLMSISNWTAGYTLLRSCGVSFLFGSSSERRVRQISVPDSKSMLLGWLSYIVDIWTADKKRLQSLRWRKIVPRWWPEYSSGLKNFDSRRMQSPRVAWTVFDKSWVIHGAVFSEWSIAHKRWIVHKVSRWRNSTESPWPRI